MANSRFLQDWSFRQIGGDDEWLKTSEFPTSVHVELKSLKKIPDPFLGLSEWDVQWVGESDWQFKTVFDMTENELSSSNVDLVLEGLDTFCTVQLNDEEILKTDNQFLSHRKSVKSNLKPQNTLVLHFENALLKGRELEKKYGKFELWNGDASRLHVRKAQYNYGWDWGPVLMTVGPHKPVSLEMYEHRITEFDVRSQVSEKLDVKLDATFTYSAPFSGFASFTLKDSAGKVAHTLSKIPTDPGNSQVSFDFAAGTLELWYPVGYGAQPLYTVTLEIADAAGNVCDVKTQKIGFRRALVVEEKLEDEDGLSFLFEINNIRIFCGGSNWIPADSFLTSITSERYRKWLQLLVDGNQNMIRIWGGGIYEADVFYEICDELGILVWQDFMFGCGQYPAYASFLASVTEEAEQNVKRLRHHPSVMILAGNNEDYQIAESLKLELDYSDETSDFRQTNFPARHIYERVLPEIVQRLSNIHYHRGSPYSGQGKPTTDSTLGDLHQWNVWHGSQEPWSNWDILAGRFVSEFGMEGFPNIRTVDYWLAGDVSERYPQSRTNNNHNKAQGFERRLELYMVENFKHSFEMESYVYGTQIMQAETLASAYRLWRRNWRGKGREYTSGALVWQLNDCWPVTSWAIADYFLRPKPAYFTISRELRRYTVGMTRKDKTTFPDDRSNAKFTIETVLEIWATNSTLQDKKATLEVTFFDLQSSWQDQLVLSPVVLSANSSTELYKGSLTGQPPRTKLSDIPKDIIVSARLLDDDGTVLGRYSNWPEPFKFIKFPSLDEVGLKIETGQDGESVTITVSKPIKGLVLDVEGDDVKWGDQALDVVPGDPQTVKAVGLGSRKIEARFLGDGISA